MKNQTEKKVVKTIHERDNWSGTVKHTKIIYEDGTEAITNSYSCGFAAVNNGQHCINKDHCIVCKSTCNIS